MTTPAQREADAASQAFHAALTAIGAQTVADALSLWDDVPPDSKPAVAASWLRKAIALVMTRRTRSRALALSYYRLARALHTGRTIPLPGQPAATSVTLGQLRREFRQLAGEPQEADVDRETGEVQEADTGLSDPGPAIPVDPLPAGPSEDELRRRAIEEIRIALSSLGAINQARKVAEIDKSRPAEQVDKLRQQAHEEAGARQAAAAERIAQNGARSELWETAQRDSRALGYARLSRTGTPCGWCAMLISRGPVYRSEKSATLKGGAAEYDDGDKYHDNCHCYAEPIFSREQYASSEMFELNRKYAEEWPRVTRGLSGKAAVSAWRYFIRQQSKSRAQAARPTPDVQEA